MKLFHPVIWLVRCLTQRRRIVFFAAAPLFVAIACAPAETRAENPYEAIWWKDLRMQVTPIRDKNKAIFALKVVFINRALRDIAILQRPKDQMEAFFWNFGPPEFDRQKIGQSEIKLIERSPPPTSHGGTMLEQVQVEIAPGDQLSLCLKLENFVVSNQTIKQGTENRILLATTGRLAWRRSSGVVTPFYRERDADYGVIPDYDPPKFDFGDQKIAIHKNLTCEDAGK